jgi:hypothetical protein
MPQPVPGITIAPFHLRVGITIPNAGANVRELLRAGAPGQSFDGAMTFVLLGLVPGGTDRGAVVLADPRPGASITGTDYTTHGQFVPAGRDYTLPSANDLASFVKSVTGDIPAVVAVLF